MAGLNWSAFFSVEKEKSEIIKQTKNYTFDNYNPDHLRCLFQLQGINAQDEDFVTACEISVLEWATEFTTFAKDVLSGDECDKVKQLIDRGQYNSKLVKTLLSKACATFLHRVSEREKLSQLFQWKIWENLKIVHDERVTKSFAELKSEIDKITSGVKSECYLSAAIAYRPYSLEFDEKSNAYLKDKYAYDFNSIHTYPQMDSLVLFNEAAWNLTREILKLTLLNNGAFWQKQAGFDIFAFVQAVRDYNDDKHADKILDKIFGQIIADEKGKRLIENSLPIMFVREDDYINGLEERTFRFAFERFEGKCNLSKLDDECFCYPLTCPENVEKKIEIGKKVFHDLICKAVYPQCGNAVWEFLQEEIHNPKPILAKESWAIRDVFDCFTFGYHRVKLDYKAIKVLCPDYFSEENIWNRLYLKAAAMQNITASEEECFGCLYEIFYDVFQAVEQRMGVQTAYQKDTTERENRYLQLKDILKDFDVQISDEYKSDYIISLLDRKIAVLQEAERFPVLEQLGDAIYGLAVAEMLFYNPDSDSKMIAKQFEKYTSAIYQVKVARLLQLDKLYFSAMTLPCKYERDILINPDNDTYAISQEREAYSTKEKYLADSLEMIIGTICKDCGFLSALTFSKEILKKVSPDVFVSEVKWKEHNIVDNIEMDYWTRILPSPYSAFDDFLSVLWRAFDKVFLAYSLGTEDVAIRRFLTNNYGISDVYGDKCGYVVNKVFYEYLHNGLEQAINKYEKQIQENYKKEN